ncbi:MAG: tetratricopeptide repeat protein [Myxococcales bacterium]|nr:tetratricopeptide repeat protein [Myxococcales bacterium]MCB9652109.1 tetratricopeptide repeat protein [Deltaproteobacteria bacterium]
MADPVMVEGLIPVPQAEVALLLECGYLYMEMQKPREAEEIFNGVAALVPSSEVPLLCLGNLFFSLGRFDRALKFHQEALKKSPESALAQAHVGESLLFMKKRAEGKAALEKAAGMAPEGSDAAAFANSLLDALAAGVI